MGTMGDTGAALRAAHGPSRLLELTVEQRKPQPLGSDESSGPSKNSGTRRLLGVPTPSSQAMLSSEVSPGVPSVFF